MQANLGGAPSRKAEIYAFLRLRQKDAAPLDFDSPSGLDTTWQRIFFCLRSGYYQEAVEVIHCWSLVHAMYSWRHSLRADKAISSSESFATESASGC